MHLKSGSQKYGFSENYTAECPCVRGLVCVCYHEKKTLLLLHQFMFPEVIIGLVCPYNVVGISSRSVTLLPTAWRSGIRRRKLFPIFFRKFEGKRQSQFILEVIEV